MNPKPRFGHRQRREPVARRVLRSVSIPSGLLESRLVFAPLLSPAAEGQLGVMTPSHSNCDGGFWLGRVRDWVSVA